MYFTSDIQLPGGKYNATLKHVADYHGFVVWSDLLAQAAHHMVLYQHKNLSDTNIDVMSDRTPFAALVEQYDHLDKAGQKKLTTRVERPEFDFLPGKPVKNGFILDDDLDLRGVDATHPFVRTVLQQVKGVTGNVYADETRDVELPRCAFVWNGIYADRSTNFSMPSLTHIGVDEQKALHLFPEMYSDDKPERRKAVAEYLTSSPMGPSGYQNLERYNHLCARDSVGLAMPHLEELMRGSLILPNAKDVTLGEAFVRDGDIDLHGSSLENQITPDHIISPTLGNRNAVYYMNRYLLHTGNATRETQRPLIKKTDINSLMSLLHEEQELSEEKTNDGSRMGMLPAQSYTQDVIEGYREFAQNCLGMVQSVGYARYILERNKLNDFKGNMFSAAWNTIKNVWNNKQR